MKEIIILIVSIFIFVTNLKFFNGIFIYIPVALLFGFIIYSSKILNQKKKFILVNSLKDFIKLMMGFSIIVAVFGLYMTYARSNMQGFDKDMNYEAFGVGLRNFILSVISYCIIAFTSNKKGRRIK